MANSFDPYLDAVQEGVKFEPTYEVSAVNQVGTNMSMVMPDFWPTEIYNAYFGQECHKDSVIPLIFGNETYEGVLLPPIAGPYPIGVVKIRNFCSSMAELRKLV
eukprot:4364098-Lingulodinium_polyedra.AAC.1